MCQWSPHLDTIWNHVVNITVTPQEFHGISNLWQLYCFINSKENTKALHYNPRWQKSWDPYGADLSPVGPRWTPLWPGKPCYQGSLLVMEIHQSLVEFPHNRPVMHEVFPCHDVIMENYVIFLCCTPTFTFQLIEHKYFMMLQRASKHLYCHVYWPLLNSLPSATSHEMLWTTENLSV